MLPPNFKFPVISLASIPWIGLEDIVGETLTDYLLSKRNGDTDFKLFIFYLAHLF